MSDKVLPAGSSAASAAALSRSYRARVRLPGLRGCRGAIERAGVGGAFAGLVLSGAALPLVGVALTPAAGIAAAGLGGVVAAIAALRR